MHGKSIRIFLPDNNVTGLRFAEVVNWTGQAIACPRQRLGELKHWSESQKPGVYFLFEKPFVNSESRVYIGEAENVLQRLGQHVREKEFWHEVVLFTSKDDNLTKGHVKFLEALLYQEALAAGRYVCENSNVPVAPELPRADKAAMAEFLSNLRMVLGTLGFVALEPLIRSNIGNTQQNEPMQELEFRIKGIAAYGAVTDEGFVLKQNSQICIDVGPSLPSALSELRQSLLDERVLVQTGDHYLLNKNTVFSSPSYAAAFVAGTSRNGLDSWKTASGISLKVLESQLVDEAL